MNKIIPIISIIVSALCISAAALALVLVCVAVNVPQFKLISVPTAIVSDVASILSVGFNLLFRKSKLCRIALYICLVAVALSVASIVVWLCAL